MLNHNIFQLIYSNDSYLFYFSFFFMPNWKYFIKQANNNYQRKQSTKFVVVFRNNFLKMHDYNKKYIFLNNDHFSFKTLHIFLHGNHILLKYTNMMIKQSNQQLFCCFCSLKFTYSFSNAWNIIFKIMVNSLNFA